MKLDVAVMTRNSGRFLERCLNSVEQGIDMNRLIVVDGGSTDSTIDIAESHGAKILSDRGRNLGYARALAIKYVETPWFAFVDSDIQLPTDWQRKVVRYKLYKAGAVESLPINVAQPGENQVTETHNQIMNHRYGHVTAYRGRAARGFTGATLLRHDIVQDTEIPDLPCCEDWVLTQHVIAKGYNWYRVPVPVKHHDRYSQRPERIAQTYAVARALGYMPLSKLLAKSTFALLARLAVATFYLNPSYLLHRVTYTRHALDGWLHPHRYLDMKYPGWEAPQ